MSDSSDSSKSARSNQSTSWLSRATRALARPGHKPVVESPSRTGKLLRKAASRAKTVAQKLPVQESLDKVLMTLSDPRVARVIQQGMMTLGSAGMEATFAREPGAKLLFDFATWCDEKASRGEITALLLQDALSPNGGFFNIYKPLLDLGAIKDPLSYLSAAPPSERMADALRNGHRGATLTLCNMMAQATGKIPPESHEDLEVLLDFLRQEGIPEEFQDLPDLILGKTLLSRREKSSESDKSTTTSDATPSSLLPTRAFPPELRFVVGPYLLFMQFYMTRNMVDALPEMMGRIRSELEEEKERQKKTSEEPRIIEIGKS